jgi:hypothetical protein
MSIKYEVIRCVQVRTEWTRLPYTLEQRETHPFARPRRGNRRHLRDRFTVLGDQQTFLTRGARHLTLT